MWSYSLETINANIKGFQEVTPGVRVKLVDDPAAVEVAEPDVVKTMGAGRHAFTVLPMRHVHDAVGRGARVLAGGGPAEGRYVPPTALDPGRAPGQAL